MFLNFPEPFSLWQEGLPIKWFDLLFFILPQDKLRSRGEQWLAQATGPTTGGNGTSILTLAAASSPAWTQHSGQGFRVCPVTPQTWRIRMAHTARRTEKAERSFPE